MYFLSGKQIPFGYVDGSIQLLVNGEQWVVSYI